VARRCSVNAALSAAIPIPGEAKARLPGGEMPPQPLRLPRDALAVAERSGDRLAIGYTLHALSLRSEMRRDAAGMLELTGRGLAVIGDDPEGTDLRLLMLANRAAEFREFDRQDEAMQTAREALLLAEEAGTPRVATARFSLADQFFCIGQWDDALAELEPAVGLPGPDYLPMLVHGLIAAIAAHRQDWQTAEDHLSGEPDGQTGRPPGRRTGTTSWWRGGCSRSGQANTAKRLGCCR
jgi:hypothetical protein